MLKHEWYHFAILRRAVNGHSGCEHLGWPTTWGGLGQIIRESGLDECGRDPMDALMQLHERKMIILKKTHTNGLWFTTYDYDEYPDKRKFFRGEFGLYVTPAGSAYFNELEVKAFAANPDRSSSKAVEDRFQRLAPSSPVQCVAHFRDL